jgi:hypothetical protein
MPNLDIGEILAPAFFIATFVFNTMVEIRIMFPASWISTQSPIGYGSHGTLSAFSLQ